MKETLVLNGKTFDVLPLHITREGVGKYFDYGKRDLFYYYDRPSHTKLAIWDSWKYWSQEVDGISSFGVSSANTYQFTITGLYHTKSGQSYLLVITKAHLTAYKLYSLYEKEEN